jgi:hypothetical protein
LPDFYIGAHAAVGGLPMYTSALLEGKDRHFESARIVELKR